MSQQPGSRAPEQTTSSRGQHAAPVSRSGLLYGFAAYALWGALPIYFVAMLPTGAFELVAWRIVFSLVFCALLIVVTRAWRPLFALRKKPRLVLMIGVAGVLIYLNWQVYAYAVLGGQVIEAALGYFINPIVTVLLGVLVLHERLRIAQWVAVGVSVIAVVVLAVGYGALPWVSLAVAFTFGLYGLVKKKQGGHVDAVSGLTLETLWLTPIAVVQLLVVAATTGLTFGALGTWHTLGLVASGVITAVPLLLFASATRRLPLTYVGLLQYLAPILQFVFGAFIMHEQMPPERWLGFALVWIALVILTVDMVASGRGPKRVALRPA